MIVGDDFKARCLCWAGPVGPLTTFEEDLEAKELFAKRLATSALRDCLAEAASWALENNFEDLSMSAFDFAGILHRVGRGRELGAEIVKLLTPNGPPLLVDLWGEARQQYQTASMLQKLDVPNASAELQIALAGALGRVKGAVALDMVRALEGQARSPEAASEIQIALRNIEGLLLHSHATASLIVGKRLALGDPIDCWWSRLAEGASARHGDEPQRGEQNVTPQCSASRIYRDSMFPEVGAGSWLAVEPLDQPVASSQHRTTGARCWEFGHASIHPHIGLQGLQPTLQRAA